MNFKKDKEKIYFKGFILGENTTGDMIFNKNDIIVTQPAFSMLFMDLKIQDFPYESEFTIESYENYSILTKNVGDISPFNVRFHFIEYYWKENIKLYDYILILKKELEKNSLFNEVSSIIGRKGFDIELSLDTTNNTIIKEKLYEISKIFYKINDKLLNSFRINKEIKFSKEHLSAGISILQYFGKILQEKYPNDKVSVSIKQEDLKVTMTIETPDGKKEEIEEYLNRYGMVMTNQITPQEFTSNPIQVLELETKLESAKMEIGFQKKLLALQDKTYDENLVSLKDEVYFLRDELSAIRISNNEQITLLLSSLLTKDKLIKQFAKSIDKRDKKETKQLLLELKEKDSKGYTSLKEHLDSVIVGNLTNTPSWLEFIKQLF